MRWPDFGNDVDRGTNTHCPRRVDGDGRFNPRSGLVHEELKLSYNTLFQFELPLDGCRCSRDSAHSKFVA
jgi:hypothetical protein